MSEATDEERTSYGQGSSPLRGVKDPAIICSNYISYLHARDSLLEWHDFSVGKRICASEVDAIDGHLLVKRDDTIP